MRYYLIIGGLLLLFYVLVEFMPWHSSWQPPSWPPTNASALDLTPTDKTRVMTTLLIENRQEVRFWHDKVFTISFWLNAAILGIIAVLVKTEEVTNRVRYYSITAFFILCIFYLFFLHFAEKAIAVNDADNIRIQYALQLSQPNRYLAENQVIYQPELHSSPPLHEYIRYLVRFNVFLVIGSTILLLFVPLRNRQHAANNHPPTELARRLG